MVISNDKVDQMVSWVGCRLAFKGSRRETGIDWSTRCLRLASCCLPWQIGAMEITSM